MLRALTVLIILLPFIGTSQDPWINEIHYDNVSTDMNECIEIAGTAGTDLSCLSIVLYNGGTPYSTTFFPLGFMPDEGCGFGAYIYCYASNGIQNGSADGIVLYDNCTLMVLQFLSYEGVILATSGVANGMTSTDIGVAESGSTLATESLQLTGSGNSYGAFTWNTPAASNMGWLNAGQTITPCGSNTITTGVVTGAPFTVDCNVPTTDAGTVAFTSTGTFNGPNIYTAQLSDASGSFASPTNIGTLASTTNSGTISIIIPSGMATGSGYLIRVIADDPSTIGSSSASFTITQTGACGTPLPAAEGLIINEWSNGDSGNREYYEFVVSGQCGTSVDIRGYILDDNNGTFTTPAFYDATLSGIAPGHFRFAYVAQWAAVPVGSLILIYNASDPNTSLPADDPTDANVDSLYVVPHNNALFERCTTMPLQNDPDSVYTPCVYAVAPLAGWGPLSLRNSGDAIQVRSPNGSYYHGVSYGNAEISGGPHNLKQFTGSASGRCGWFSDGDFFDISNWSSGTVAGNETPGVANNALNATWLAAMRDPGGATCPVLPLPVELLLFEGKKIDEGNLLYWQTQSEHNSSYYTLEHSIDAKNWTVINEQPAAGHSMTTQTYSFIDAGFDRTNNYYRLTETDTDGAGTLFPKYVVLYNDLQTVELIRVINILGQKIDVNTSGIQIRVYSDGTSEKFFKP